ncbi:MAG: 50S ribosomal protein L6 [Deltaproteobacteria bacterium]|nr:50S ribosomal protein L6 [Deltaproteobacteria bacterium]
MSKTGKKPVVLPDKVKARIDGGVLHVEGPQGKEEAAVNPHVTVEADAKEIRVKRVDDSREARQAHGLFRSLVSNMVTGVSQGFKRELEIQGIGYRAEIKGNSLTMALGFSHPVEFPIPAGLKVAVEKQTKLTLTGASKALVGETAAHIRGLRPPEPYKGKGIKYAGELIQRKVGKAAAGATGATGGAGKAAK